MAKSVHGHPFDRLSNDGLTVQELLDALSTLCKRGGRNLKVFVEIRTEDHGVAETKCVKLETVKADPEQCPTCKHTVAGPSHFVRLSGEE